MSHIPAARTGRRLLVTVLALLAMAAQLAVALSPLAEGRERDWGSHVEADGARQHYAHSEATCAACQARSIHGTTGRPSAPPVRVRHVALGPSQRSIDAVSSDRFPQDNPRAPPTVI
ncbi:MAG TPA: hypothetical protein VLN49_08845 [Gemmatimonadaceae bacterium]|nr:hypothetical protein [Gemmatimonadaceae bacterium]